MTKCTHKHTHTKWHLFYIGLLLLSMAHTSMCLICPVSLHYRRPIFPFPSGCQLQISSWLGLGLCLLPCLSDGILSDMNLFRYYPCQYSLCELLSMLVLLCLGMLFPWSRPLCCLELFYLLFPEVLERGHCIFFPAYICLV